MRLFRLGATIAIVGLTSCQFVFREGERDADANNDAAVGDAAVPPANVIFLTDAVFNGSFGGRAFADDQCRAAALDGNFVGNFVAVITEPSGGTDALATSRLSTARGWVRPDGKPVMENAADLISGKQWYPIAQDQRGNDLGIGATYWSGSSSSGGVSTDCNKWTDASDQGDGAVGHGQLAAGLGAGRLRCDQGAHFLCAGIDVQGAIVPPKGTGKHIFVSTIPFGPTAAGRQAADDICAAEARSASLAGTYLAFLGTKAANPLSRFNGFDTYQRIDGQPLGLLAAPPLSFINRSATNTIVNSQVWADEPGTAPRDNCEDWTLPFDIYFGNLGRSNTAGSGAYADYFTTFSSCTMSFRVYCVEK